MKNYILKKTQAGKVNKLYLLQFVLITAIIAGTILKQPKLVSICFFCTFIVLAAYFASYLYVEKALSSSSILLLFTIILIIMNVMIGHVTLNFDYYRKAIMFISTLIFFCLISNANVNTKTANFILAINIVIACLYPLAYLLGIRTTYAGSLSFNFSNPNLTGMYILHSLLYCFIAFSYYKKKLVKLFLAALVTWLVFLLLNTSARSCIIAASVFAALIIINAVTFNKIRISKTVSAILIMSPIIIAIIYMLMVNSGAISIFNFAISEGKPLVSRYEVWSTAWYSIKNNILFGNYYGLGGIFGQSQMHNTHLDVLASYGIIVFVLYLSILIKIANKINAKTFTRFQRNSMFAFYTIIIMGSFEAALVSGGIGIYILSGGFLILAQYRNEDT